jgi:hypothetical protein
MAIGEDFARSDEIMDMDTKIGVFVVALWLGLAASCGGQNNEQVWLYIFNGYPGAESMSMYGPSGTVTSSLSFGSRTPNPVGVNRNLGTQFDLVLQGAPQSFEVELPLYDMYPHETATVFFKRRSSADTVDDPYLFRHVQTGYSDDNDARDRCRLIFDNGLSVQNDEIGNFNYIPLVKIRPSCTSFVGQIRSFDDTGQQITTPAGDTVQAGRPWLYSNDINHPSNRYGGRTPFNYQWFFPATAESGQVLDIRNRGQPACGNVAANKRGTGTASTVAGEHTVNYVWAPPGSQVDYESGSLRAPPPTREYMNCIGWDPDKPPNRQNIRTEQVLKCRMTENSTQTVKLNREIVSYRFNTGIGLKEGGGKVPDDQCGFGTRMASDFFNVFEEPDGEMAQRVTRDIQFNPNQYYFWVTYGRPVNPLIESWGADTPDGGGGFVPLPDYPGLEGETR